MGKRSETKLLRNEKNGKNENFQNSTHRNGSETFDGSFESRGDAGSAGLGRDVGFAKVGSAEAMPTLHCFSLLLVRRNRCISTQRCRSEAVEGPTESGDCSGEDAEVIG